MQVTHYNSLLGGSATFDESGPGGIWADNQQVISKPDFKYFIVEKTFEFVILASDGLWDVFKSSEVNAHCAMKCIS